MKFVTIFDPKTGVNFVKYFKISWIVTALIIASAIGGLLTLGMPWGIDFLGGMEMQVKFDRAVSADDIRDVLDDLGFDKNQVQQFGASQNHEMLVRVESVAVLKENDLSTIKNLLESDFGAGAQGQEKAKLLYDQRSGSQLSVWLPEPLGENGSDAIAKKAALDAQRKELAKLLDEKAGLELRKSTQALGEEADVSHAVLADEPQNGMVRYTVQFAGVSYKIQKALANKFGSVEVRRVDFVDSQVSRQLRTDGLLAVIYAILAIVIYIAIRFDIYFSPGAVFSLINDSLGGLLVFILFRIEFDTPSIAALLTIVGYSINNTVVVYDRIRETLPHNPKKPLSIDEIKPYVNKAINDTLSRTINTTLTTLFASVAIWIFATGAIQNFAIVLSIGIVVGAFSSVFVAPASYLLAKRYIQPANQGYDLSDASSSTNGRPSREDRAKGVV